MNKYGFGAEIKSIRKHSFELVLELLTVKEIKKVIDHFDLPIRKSTRKAELIFSVATMLRTNPQHIVDKLEAHEIIVLQKLLAGEKVVGDDLVLCQFYWLVGLGCIALRDVEDEPYASELILTDEADMLLRPLIDKLPQSRRRQIFQIITGWGALCGILPLKTALSFIKRQPGFEDVSFSELLDVVRYYADTDEIVYEKILDDGYGDFAYLSRWKNITGTIGSFIYKEVDRNGKKVQVNAYETKEFTLDEIIDASMPLFAPVTPNSKERHSLTKVCRQRGMSDAQTQEFLLECWMAKQQESDIKGFTEIFDKIKPTSIDDANRVMAAATGYTNTLPFWRFLGMSSSESLERERASMTRPPRIVAGPNMRAMGMDIPDGLQERLDKIWAESAQGSCSSPSVGRNDPCPCGSGKKYKKCCGR